MIKANREIFRTLEKVCIANPAEIKMAAAIVRRNRIISIGMNNLNKSHPLAAKFAKSKEAIFPHAEISAIKNALREIDVDDLLKTEMYVCRVKKPKPRSKIWVPGLAKPCEGCRRAILEFGIKRVLYTTDEENVYGEL